MKKPKKKADPPKEDRHILNNHNIVEFDTATLDVLQKFIVVLKGIEKIADAFEVIGKLASWLYKNKYALIAIYVALRFTDLGELTAWIEGKL